MNTASRLSRRTICQNSRQVPRLFVPAENLQRRSEKGYATFDDRRWFEHVKQEKICKPWTGLTAPLIPLVVKTYSSVEQWWSQVSRQTNRDQPYLEAQFTTYIWPSELPNSSRFRLPSSYDTVPKNLPAIVKFSSEQTKTLWKKS